MIAQRTVTTTVRRIVFHNNVQVSGLQMRLQTVDQLESRASRSRKTSGAASTTATARLSANRISDGTRRRGPTTAACPAVVWSGAPGTCGYGRHWRRRGGAGVAAARRAHSRPACRSKEIARRAVAQVGDRHRIRLQLRERHLLGRGRDARRERVLVAFRVRDDLLGLRGHQERQEALGVGLVAARLEDPGAGDVDDVAGVVRRQERDLGVHVGRADLVPDPVPVVLVDDPEGGAAAVDLVDDGLVVWGRRGRRRLTARPLSQLTAAVSP